MRSFLLVGWYSTVLVSWAENVWRLVLHLLCCRIVVTHRAILILNGSRGRRGGVINKGLSVLGPVFQSVLTPTSRCP